MLMVLNVFYTILFVLMMLGIIGFVALIFGFYYGMGYANLKEEDIRNDAKSEKLARFGSWIIRHVEW